MKVVKLDGVNDLEELMIYGGAIEFRWGGGESRLAWCWVRRNLPASNTSKCDFERLSRRQQNKRNEARQAQNRPPDGIMRQCDSSDGTKDVDSH